MNINHTTPITNQPRTSYANHAPRGTHNHSKHYQSSNQNQLSQQILNQLLPLILQLLTQLLQNQEQPNPQQPPLQEIPFDEGSPKAITHLGNDKNNTAIKSIEFFGDGYRGILENGSGFGTQIAAGSSDPRPRINGQFVTRADYTNDTATYTLEDGTMLTGVKPFIPSQSNTSPTPTPQPLPSLPTVVSGGNVSVGQSTSGEAIPNDRVVTIEGKNYSVGFLKQQVDDYANSPYAETPTNPVAQATTDYPWGVPSLLYFGDAFESYISDTFPNGDPSAPTNPNVRYENRSLIVNGQAYSSTPLPSPVSSNQLIIGPGNASDSSANQQALAQYNDVQVVREFLGGFLLVEVPSSYLSQWQQALANNLPNQSNVDFNGIATTT